MSPYIKASLVIRSCTTLEQLLCAAKFSRLARRHCTKSDYRDLYLQLLLKRRQLYGVRR